jgi:uncharacterized protein (DUF1330 family)
MPAYLINYRETPIRDQDSFAEYQRRNRETDPTEFKITPLVVYGAVHALEGQAPDGVVMLQFPTVEDAKAWYNSPAYQAALPLRLNAAEYRTIIVEGF